MGFRLNSTLTKEGKYSILKQKNEENKNNEKSDNCGNGRNNDVDGGIYDKRLYR